MNLAIECLERNASRIPDSIAVIDGNTGVEYTYAELNRNVNRMASALKSMGVARGDRVAIFIKNSPEFILSFFASCKLGAISVPINTMLKRLEIEYILNNSEAKVVAGMAEETRANVIPVLSKLSSVKKVILVGAGTESDTILGFADVLESGQEEFIALELEENDPISLLYTSGTTGRPKGALASHSNWFYQTWSSAYQIVPMTDDDIVLTGGPFFHVYLVIAVLTTLYVGATVLTLPRFSPKQALGIITKHKVTHFMGTPTMWTYMIEEYLQNKKIYNISSLWQGQTAGSPLSAELGRRIERIFDIGLIECYGATECSATAANTRFGHLTPGHPGRVTPGWEIKIMDDNGKELSNGEVGEIWCRGPGVIKEYWKDPDMTRERFVDGWWRSGDMGHRLDGSRTDGHLYIAGRKDDMIVCGGYNIFPIEVESYMIQHPKILQIVVIGVPDNVKGQIPKAFVVLAPGENASEDEIIKWTKNKIAPYKCPRKVEFVNIDDLPKTASGKILKRELRKKEEGKAGK